MSLAFRQATTEDIPLLMTMHRRLMADEQYDAVITDNELLRFWNSFFGRSYITLVFTDDSDAIVGYTLTDHGRTPRYLRHLYINDGYRRKGYGRRLINLTMEHLGVTEIDLEVMVWNANARRFYEKIGCRERYLGMRYSLT